MTLEVATDTASACAGCGAPLAADQRYCLACGHPASPVRLAFLDVLQGESQPTAALLPTGLAAAAYDPPGEPAGLLGSLRRYSGLLALLGVLVGCLLVGLLVGHWISGNGSPAGPQVVKIEGLGGPLAAAPATTTPSTGASAAAPSPKSATPAKSEAAEEAKEAAEVKTTKPLPPAHKAPAATLQKISKTTGKQHQKEINQLVNSGKPIETGG
jgi:hypothetical protein